MPFNLEPCQCYSFCLYRQRRSGIKPSKIYIYSTSTRDIVFRSITIFFAALKHAITAIHKCAITDQKAKNFMINVIDGFRCVYVDSSNGECRHIHTWDTRCISHFIINLFACVIHRSHLLCCGVKPNIVNSRIDVSKSISLFGNLYGTLFNMFCCFVKMLFIPNGT